MPNKTAAVDGLAGREDDVELPMKLLAGLPVSPNTVQGSGEASLTPIDYDSLVHKLVLSSTGTDLMMAAKSFELEGDSQGLDKAIAAVDGAPLGYDPKVVFGILKEHYL